MVVTKSTSEPAPYIFNVTMRFGAEQTTYALERPASGFGEANSSVTAEFPSSDALLGDGPTCSITHLAPQR